MSKSTYRTEIKPNVSLIQAFNKAILARTTDLFYEYHCRLLMLFSDASDTHVRAVLGQEGENRKYVI